MIPNFSWLIPVLITSRWKKPWGSITLSIINKKCCILFFQRTVERSLFYRSSAFQNSFLDSYLRLSALTSGIMLYCTSRAHHNLPRSWIFFKTISLFHYRLPSCRRISLQNCLLKSEFMHRNSIVNHFIAIDCDWSYLVLVWFDHANFHRWTIQQRDFNRNFNKFKLIASTYRYYVNLRLSMSGVRGTSTQLQAGIGLTKKITAWGLITLITL